MQLQKGMQFHQKNKKLNMEYSYMNFLDNLVKIKNTIAYSPMEGFYCSLTIFPLMEQNHFNLIHVSHFDWAWRNYFWSLSSLTNKLFINSAIQLVILHFKTQQTPHIISLFGLLSFSRIVVKQLLQQTYKVLSPHKLFQSTNCPLDSMKTINKQRTILTYVTGKRF